MSEKEAHYYRLYAQDERAKVDRVRKAVTTGRAEADREFWKYGDHLFLGRRQAYDAILSVLDRGES